MHDPLCPVDPPRMDDGFCIWCEVIAKVRADERQHPRDEYHTMDELYSYRMLYNAAFAFVAQQWHTVTKSYRHSDGEPCFGGGWFIVTMHLPQGQVSNHYENEHWDLFRVREVEKAPEWDGHTPAEAAERLRQYCLGDSR
jgi:hypothetical protein